MKRVAMESGKMFGRHTSRKRGAASTMLLALMTPVLVVSSVSGSVLSGYEQKINTDTAIELAAKDVAAKLTAVTVTYGSERLGLIEFNHKTARCRANQDLAAELDNRNLENLIDSDRLGLERAAAELTHALTSRQEVERLQKQAASALSTELVGVEVVPGSVKVSVGYAVDVDVATAVPVVDPDATTGSASKGGYFLPYCNVPVDGHNYVFAAVAPAPAIIPTENFRADSSAIVPARFFKHATNALPPSVVLVQADVRSKSFPTCLLSPTVHLSACAITGGNTRTSTRAGLALPLSLINDEFSSDFTSVKRALNAAQMAPGCDDETTRKNCEKLAQNIYGWLRQLDPSVSRKNIARGFAADLSKLDVTPGPDSAKVEKSIALLQAQLEQVRAEITETDADRAANAAVSEVRQRQVASVRALAKRAKILTPGLEARKNRLLDELKSHGLDLRSRHIDCDWRIVVTDCRAGKLFNELKEVLNRADHLVTSAELAGDRLRGLNKGLDYNRLKTAVHAEIVSKSEPYEPQLLINSNGSISRIDNALACNYQ